MDEYSHLVAVTNNNFAIAMVALIRSVKHCMPHCRISVLQVDGRGTEKKWQDLFHKEGAEILWVDASPISKILDSFPGIHHYGPETYTKFLLPSYLDEPFWWIDTDMLMQRPLTSKSVSVDLTKGLMIAPYHVEVSESFKGLLHKEVYDQFAAVCDLDEIITQDQAVNGGVIWMNPSILRQTDFQERSLALLAALHPYLNEADESILNLMRPEYSFEFLPEHIQRFVGDNVPYECRETQEPVFHHYIGRTKPWMDGYSNKNAISAYKQWLGHEWNLR